MLSVSLLLADRGCCLALSLSLSISLSAAEGVEAGELRMADLGLGEIPLAGFAVLAALLVGEPSTTALDVSKSDPLASRRAFLGPLTSRRNSHLNSCRACLAHTLGLVTIFRTRLLAQPAALARACDSEWPTL